MTMALCYLGTPAEIVFCRAGGNEQRVVGARLRNLNHGRGLSASLYTPQRFAILA